MSICVLEMIPYEESRQYEEALGGWGGFFIDGMRWKDYLGVLPEDCLLYAEAFRSYVVKHYIKQGGEWHQNSQEGVPLFSDNRVATFSLRAWGDFMAAAWSEAEDKDYSYMDFYM